MKRKELTLGEEIANSITHGIGAVLSIAALVMLLFISIRYGQPLDIVGVAIFGCSMIFLYMMSTMCHSFALSEGTTRKVFRILDHSAIYVLIAGTYTPFCLSVIGGTQGYVILVIQWGLALTGILLRTLFYDRYTLVHVVIYLAMGWMVGVFIKSLYPIISSGGLILLIAGGLSYSIGILFYAIRMFKYHHMVWHLFVIAGTACHFFLVYLYVLPR